MFSEYASRFLAQSQSRLSFGQPDPDRSVNPLDRNRSSRLPSHGYLQRQPPSGNPYNPSASQISRFPFASRLSQNPAPLFYSATDEFREEDDGEEHEREVADYYALQRSRRDFGAPISSTQLPERDDLSSRGQLFKSARRGLTRMQDRRFPRGQGIRSSWTADEAEAENEDQAPGEEGSHAGGLSVAGSMLGKTKDRLVDVELASTIDEAEEPDEGTNSEDDNENPPSLQQLRRQPERQRLLQASRYSQRGPAESVTMSKMRVAMSSSSESIPPTLVTSPAPGPPQHDAFFASLYKICLVGFFSSFVLVLLHTSAPDKRSRLGDTIYSTLTASYFLFATDTVIAVVVSLAWLAMLRHYVRALVMLIIVSVPVILFSFALYPFVASFGGTWHGSSFQDRAMRWGSLIPLALAAFWCFTVYKGRPSLGRAIELLEFSTRILEAMPALVIVGFATLAAVIMWSWIWMLMFTRVFLGGHFSTSKLFIINTGTWWLAVFFVLMYLWTLGIIAGIQRATTAATVSQWYFHRYVTPAPTSQRVVQASVGHATTTIFGTICFSSMLALAIRMPLLVLPGRMTKYLSLFFYSIVPTSVASLTNPLTMTYAAIHSQPLALSSRGLSELNFVSSTTPTTMLTPRAFSKTENQDGASAPLIAYRLSKLILHATRWIASMAFGFGGWISTARMLSMKGAGYKGSLYAYVVGLIAGAIGYAVLGAMEGVLGGVLDAVVVCWGSEVGAQGNGTARYCREAGVLLGEDDSGGNV